MQRRLRKEGTPDECEQAAALLGQTFTVVSVGDPYPNRGRSRLVRVYVEVRLDPERTRPPQPSLPHHASGSRATASTGSCLARSPPPVPALPSIPSPALPGWVPRPPVYLGEPASHRFPHP